VGCVKALIDGHRRSMAVKRDVFERPRTGRDPGADGVVSQGDHELVPQQAGHVVNTSPWRLVDYREWTRAPKLEEYDFA
jgi:hypothetical protein